MIKVPDVVLASCLALALAPARAISKRCMQQLVPVHIASLILQAGGQAGRQAGRHRPSHVIDSDRGFSARSVALDAAMTVSRHAASSLSHPA